ncbi:MAG: restriction endonuclease subunit S [Parvularcula sp.]|nr:restriction endonuclease subunit S [Parvularcula sp.]
MKADSIPFGHLAEIQPTVRLVRGAEYDFVAMEDVKPNRRHAEVKSRRKWDGGGGSRFGNGDTVFARITPCLENGKTALISGLSSDVGLGSTEFLVFRSKPNISDERFIYYLARSDLIREPAIKSMVGASGRQRAQLSVIERIPVPALPVIVQEKIADILSAYDELIENNRRRIALLEEAARLLYREWFVHFRFPGHEHISFTDGLPEGWAQVPAAEAFEVNPKTSRNDDGVIRYIPMSALSETGMVIDRGPVEDRDKSTSVRFRNGDTLLARITPCLENGKTGYVQFLSEDEVACGSTEFIVLRGRRVSNYIVYLTARQHDFRENAIRSMIGSSGRQRVQPSCFDRYLVPIPPQVLSTLFDEAVGGMFAQIGNLDQQNQKLAQARDLLLPRLMNGEITV